VCICVAQVPYTTRLCNNTFAARGLEDFFPVVLLCKIFCCGGELFLVLLLYLENNRYMMGRRNRYFKGMEDGQMTPLGHPNFNSYIKKIYVFWYSRHTNGWTGGWMD
jgi:hypothetical protein